MYTHTYTASLWLAPVPGGGAGVQKKQYRPGPVGRSSSCSHSCPLQRKGKGCPPGLARATSVPCISLHINVPPALDVSCY
jgi:hypothetical protein